MTSEGSQGLPGALELGEKTEVHQLPPRHGGNVTGVRDNRACQGYAERVMQVALARGGPTRLAPGPQSWDPNQVCRPWAFPPLHAALKS